MTKPVKANEAQEQEPVEVSVQPQTDKADQKPRDYFKVIDTVMEKSETVEPDKVLSLFGKYKGMVFLTAVGFLVISVFLNSFFANVFLIVMALISFTNMIFNTFGGRDSTNQAIDKAVVAVTDKLSKKSKDSADAATK
jgi:hypothetical protein